MQVDDFNALDETEARSTVDSCLGVVRWVDEVVEGRPYADLATLLEQARASAENLGADELAAALSRHPRIGERAASGDTKAALSAVEQSGINAADTNIATRLREGNQRYEDRFDRVFLIRAADRDSDEVLSELERRLGNDDETERRETVSELRQIALLRLEKAVTA